TVGGVGALGGENRTRERFWALLMRALYQAGRQADALDAYRRARRALVEELGVEPGRQLRDVERLVLAHDPSLDPAPRLPGRPSAGPEQEREPPAGAEPAVPEHEARPGGPEPAPH